MEPAEPLSSRRIVRRAGEGLRRGGLGTNLLVPALATAPGMGLGLVRYPASALFPPDWAGALHDSLEISATVLYLGGALLAHGALTHATASALEERTTTLLTSLRVGATRLPVLAVVCAVAIVGMTVGCVALLAPGLFLAASLLPSSAVAMVEATGPLEALRRCFELTRRDRAALAGVVLTLLGLAGLGCCAWGCVVSGITVTSDLDELTWLETPVGQFASALVNHCYRLALVVAISACSGAAYVELRRGRSELPRPVEF